MEVKLIGTGSILTARMSASALVDRKVLIDTPNGTMKAIRRAGLDPAAIDICLITHFHADHFLDIVFLFVELGLRQRRDKELVLIGPDGFANRVEQLFLLSYPESWERVRGNVQPRFVEFSKDGGTWSGDGYEIRALPVRHTVPISFGYHITGEDGARLGYTGDTVYCPSVETLASTSDALIIDTAFLKSRSGHMGLDDVEALADRWPDLPLIATHLSDDVTTSSRANIVFPEDGHVAEVKPD